MLQIVMSALLAMGTVQTGEDQLWRQWRGPERTGQWSGPTWPERLEPENVQTKWYVDDLGPSYCGPVMSEDMIFTAETRDERSEVVQAYNRRSGELKWEVVWEGAMEVPFFASKNGSWIRATPALSDGRLYVAGMRDVLVCLDAATGEEHWRFDFVEKLGAPDPDFGFVCSPLVTDEHVYVQAGASFCKLTKVKGELVWRTLEDKGGMMGSAFSSPIMATLDGVPQLVVLGRETLSGVDPETGEVFWKTPIKSFRGMNILTPIVVDGGILTAPYGGRCQMLDVTREEEGWDVQVRWDNNLQGYMTSPVVVNGHAYFLNRSNRFCCTRLSDGEVMWISPPTGDNYWSLVAQGDRILSLSDSGLLRLIKANPEVYEPFDDVQLTESDTWAHIAVAEGELVIREQDGLRVLTWK